MLNHRPSMRFALFAVGWLKRGMLSVLAYALYF